MEDRPQSGAEARPEQRRGSRFRVVVLVHAKWQDADRKAAEETAHAREVNAMGGLLEMSALPIPGSELELTNLASGATARARVTGIRRSKEGSVAGVAVELVSPSETFWGLNFQLRKASSDLVTIEQAIKTGGVDPRILEEFRDAVDYVRKTAWAVQEWQERQLQKHDPQTVLPLITAERIRRATQLSNSILTDLSTHEVTRETVGMTEFFQALGKLYRHVVELLSDRPV